MLATLTTRAYRMLSVLFVAMFLGSCDDSSSSVDPWAATIAEGRATVKEVMAETEATSVSVALVDGDQIIWSEAFGSAERETERQATTRTLYSACSVSKMLATAATLILVDQGKVALDEPLVSYVKNFEMPLDQRYRKITVRMLLNHSSGLPGNDMRGAITDAPFPGYAVQALESLRHMRLKHTPGSIASYNNDGFTMVQNLVKAVTSQEYPDFVRQNILTPLGMNSSRYQTEPLAEGSFARSYGGNSKLTMYSVNTYGSGSLFSTPEEMSRLAAMFINMGTLNSRQILSPATVAAMAQDQRAGTLNPTPNEEYRFGLGWDTVSQPGLAAVGVKAWQKTGDMSGYFGSNMLVLPEEKLGVVVFGASNGFDSAHAVKISERILLRALVERGKLAAMPQQIPDVPLLVEAASSAEMIDFAGYYASGVTVYRLSFASDGSLTVEEYTGKAAMSPKYQNLKKRSDGWYTADSDPNTSIGLRTEAGLSYFVLRQKRGFGHYQTTSMFAQRLDNRPGISVAWQQRLDERWLPVNDDPVLFSFGDRSFRLGTIAALNGYVMGKNILRDMTPPSADRLDGMFMALPDIIRDLQEVSLESRNNQIWLRQGSYLYRPRSELSSLAAGATTVSFGESTEWFKIPESGTVDISGSSYWSLYDAEFKTLASGITSGNATFSGAGAKYLAVFGTDGKVTNLNLTTP